jgi:hypothetical protein
MDQISPGSPQLGKDSPQCYLADAPARLVDDSGKRDLIFWIGQELEESYGVFYFFSFVKAKSSDDAVWNAFLEKAGFEQSALGIGPVKDCGFAVKIVPGSVEWRIQPPHPDR